MANETHTDDESSSLLFMGGLVLAGLALGYGVRTLYWSIGWPGHPCLNCDLANVGASGIDDLGWLPAADYSIGFVVGGVLLMLYLNATAWRRTGGY